MFASVTFAKVNTTAVAPSPSTTLRAKYWKSITVGGCTDEEVVKLRISMNGAASVMYLQGQHAEQYMQPEMHVKLLIQADAGWLLALHALLQIALMVSSKLTTFTPIHISPHFTTFILISAPLHYSAQAIRQSTANDATKGLAVCRTHVQAAGTSVKSATCMTSHRTAEINSYTLLHQSDSRCLGC
jgi:hypothetical protein